MEFTGKAKLTHENIALLPLDTFHGSPARAHINIFLSQYFQANEGPKKVLDIGCGRGNYLYFLLEPTLEQYLGVDIKSRPDWKDWILKETAIEIGVRMFQNGYRLGCEKTAGVFAQKLRDADYMEVIKVEENNE